MANNTSKFMALRPTNARQEREASLNELLRDINTRLPSLQRFLTILPTSLNSLLIHPEQWRGATDGWSDQVVKPHTVLNDSAFNDVTTLNRTVRHEIWHQLQRNHPSIYRGSQNLREFDAHLRDLENRHAFKLTPAEEFMSLRTMNQSWRQLTQADPYWRQGLMSAQRSNFQDRYNAVLPKVCHELQTTEFRTHPDYSRICGPVVNHFPWR
ncbi:MAG: hypothetical protein HC800_25020 [Phormidesmis sp. RL_2_1]|nr:hypothetical protein [Phormidesmis sp. RL_2_1]